MLNLIRRSLSWAVVLLMLSGMMSLTSPANATNWDWKYSVNCTGVSGTNPNGPIDSVDSNVKIKNLNTGETRTFNYHPNTSGPASFSWTYLGNYGMPGSWTAYEVLWVQVHGTNYHWAGSLKCGEREKPTKPHADVEKRKNVGTPDCTNRTVLVEKQKRYRSYEWDSSSWSWVPGDWSEWKTYKSHTRVSTEQECPKPPAEFRNVVTEGTPDCVTQTVEIVTSRQARGYYIGTDGKFHVGSWVEIERTVTYRDLTSEEAEVCNPPTEPTPPSEPPTTPTDPVPTPPSEPPVTEPSDSPSEVPPTSEPPVTEPTPPVTPPTSEIPTEEPPATEPPTEQPSSEAPSTGTPTETPSEASTSDSKPSEVPTTAPPTKKTPELADTGSTNVAGILALTALFSIVSGSVVLLIRRF